MRISTKLYLSTIIAIGLICLLTIFVSQYSRKITTAQQKADIANQLVQQATHLNIIFDEYLSYHYERSEQQWQNISSALLDLAEKLPPANTDRVLVELEAISSAFSRLKLETYLDLKLPKQISLSDDQIASKEIQDRLSSPIRVSAHNILSIAFMLSHQTSKEIKAINQRTFSTVLWFSLLLILLLVSSSVLIIRGITKPLGVLVADAEKIRLSDLGKTTTNKEDSLSPNNKNEIDILAQAFTRMTTQLTGTVQSLRLSEERYRTLFKTVGVSLWEEDYSEILTMLEKLREQGITDIPTYIEEHQEFVVEAARAIKVLDVNDATLKLFRAHNKEEFLGSLDKVFIPESYAVFREELVAIANGRESFEAEAVTGTLDGGRINVLMTASFPEKFRDQGRLTVSNTDITDRKLAERELENHREHLQQLVNEKTTELKIRVDEAEYLNKAMVNLLDDLQENQRQLEGSAQQLAASNVELKEFAYIVSHDLKAPLRAISQLTHWISSDYSAAFDDNGRTQMDLILQRVQRMDGLIDGILRYSRVGRIREKEEPIDLNILVNEVVDSIALSGNIQIVIEEKLPIIFRDSTRVEQVFQNLIGNAIKFMDKDEGLITVGCVDGEGFWKFSVSDNGPGIEKKYHARIFQIFQTLAPRDEHESTGIGLALVKKIIGLYGGSIWIESELGHGTTFFFTLPKKGEYDEKH
ncbi:MAG: HAMP domain-containing protein [Desulfuromusa sp.]|nr:HAMP domain-containing protein [Desulfuromusa sp.]